MGEGNLKRTEPFGQQTDGGLAAGRLSLVVTAERLFAQHGVSGVSLRTVNSEAGHKNASAIHYYFGSRDGLVKAVLDHRMPEINRRRIEMLAQVKARGLEDQLRPLIAVWVFPLAEQLQPRPEGNYYLRFLERLRREAKPEYGTWIDTFVSAWHETFRLVRSLISHLPSDVVSSRLGIVAYQISSGLATLEAGVEQGNMRHSLAFSVENLIDLIVGGLQAPVSPETAHAASLGHDLDFRVMIAREPE
jgi:AcrR family transcriptional regulator